MLAGPYGSMLMADLGAEVIKIEEPDGGDPMRSMGPPFLPNGESAYFLSINRNKKSVALDLTREAGRAVLRDLARVADVVWDNFRPGMLTKLGADPDRLRAVNARLVCCSISGFGQEGPYRDWPAFDLALQAMGGAMSITGEEGRAPVRMGLPMGDLAGGLFGALAVAGALFRRERTGQGGVVDLSLLDCQVSLLTYLAQYFWADGKVPGPMGSGHTSVVPYQALPARDGYLVVAVFAEKFWSGLCRAMERPDLEGDRRFETNLQRVAARGALIGLLEEIFATRSVRDWLEALQREGVPAAPIQSVDQVLSDPQVKHRQMVMELSHPALGRVPTLGTPIKMDAALGLEVAPAPRLGEHTEEVLMSLLAYPGERVERLRDEGVAL
jgi:formyl-CoA transferase/CoA:oxalate CoA-transferase